MKNINYNILKTIILSVIFCFSTFQINCQTKLEYGDISGYWDKSGSPYIVEGDINIPANEELVIEPGVEVRLNNGCKINVQGSLIAKGKTNDSILFTLNDTIYSANKGWHGIRFDQRPIKWDTISLKAPKTEKFRQSFMEQVINGNLDTTTKYIIVLESPDMLNDTLLSDSIFMNTKGSVLEYCKIEYGKANYRPKPYLYGGAVYIYRYSNLVIKNCVFSNNKALVGGAIYCKEAAPVISNNVFSNNKAESSAGSMAFIYSGPIIIENILKNNTSGFNGGALLFHESSPYFCNNIIFYNYSKNNGGAIMYESKQRKRKLDGAFIPEEKQEFKKDIKVDSLKLEKGIIKKSNNAGGRFINNLIYENNAKNGDGGGICIYGASPEIVNNTLVRNVSDKGSGIYCHNASPVLINSILYFNSSNTNGQIYLFGKSNPSLKYCNIPGGRTGISYDTTYKGTIDNVFSLNEDPLFNNPSDQDFTLKKGSLCIDAGMPDIDSQMVYDKDIKGEYRIKDKTIDIGAIEYKENDETFKLKSADLGDVNGEEDSSDEMYVSIFPNPANDELNLVIHNNNYEKINLEILNLNGQKVFVNEYAADTWFSKSVNISNLPNGAYRLILSSENTVLINNLIIKE